MYMPFPPDASEEDKVKTPAAIYTYPPKNGELGTKPRKRRRFRFLRIRKSGRGSVDSAPKLPFVMLEGNRAVCSICLCDFEEIVTEADGTRPKAESAAPPAGGTIEVPVEDVTEEHREGDLRLVDAGEGAQPLRLLACGHCFHVSSVCAAAVLTSDLLSS